MRRMRGARNVVDEERLVGRSGVQLLDVVDRVVGLVGNQVVAGLADPGENLRVVLEEIGLPLVGVAAHEAVEIVETHTGRPLVEWAGAAVLEGRRVVVLAEPGRGIAVLLQNRADRGVVHAKDGVVAWIAGGLLGNHTETDRMMVASGNQRRPRRRAECRGVELRVAQPHLRDAIQRRCRNDAAERAGNAVAGIVGHDQQDVGRALGRHDLRRPIGLGVLGAEIDLAAERRRRIGKIAPVDRRRGVRGAGCAGNLLGVCVRKPDRQKARCYREQ